MELISSVHVGKNGVSETLVETIKAHFKKHRNVKVVFLKNFSRDRKVIKRESEKLLDALGKNYTYRILGFTLFIKKWRKPVRE
jgi:RNA-binding protein YhbY